MKKIYMSVFSVLCFIVGYGQVGINTSTIKEGVTLQLEAANKGVLFPRVALVSRILTNPLATAIPTGTMVFNTATAGDFPNTITPGLHWWSAEEQQWTNINTNIENAVVKYTNTEVSTNYNTTVWQNARLFGNRVFNESRSIYMVNTAGNTVTIGKSGLYSISTLLSLNRLDGGSDGDVSISARVYLNGNPVGTEQVINSDHTLGVDDGKGFFSHSFTEYLELKDGDVISIGLRKTVGTYSGGDGSSAVQFSQNGESSIVISRIR
ncbi:MULTISPECIES: hypothetical protein [unclassified Chryseobacterium]|uniref:hypothetical protein n=1 Tax=unclassified Chryseobacterium TaxID=2593645 RepID=UPI00100A465C|nr:MULTISPECIES: hypothetical protein [unclassified Chryseobacterium]RXM63243.1 hypothetical protein BOQ60_18065 [Chryseobacterium sp. CH1]